MSVKSMTGYGHGAARRGSYWADVEISSVNRKQLDVRVSLPRGLALMESLVVERVQQDFSRGCVSCTVTSGQQGNTAAGDLRLDRVLAAAQVRRLRLVARQLGLKDDLSASLLLQLPGVAQTREFEWDARLFRPCLEDALDQALRRLDRMRRKEGRMLAADLRARLAAMAGMVRRLRALSPRAAAEARRQLKKRVLALGESAAAVFRNGAKELLLLAERSDISEELTRLDSHLQQALALLEQTAPVGRTLDFLSQELMREINTVGAKANYLPMTRLVIEFKAEVERVREQAQNVE